MFQDLYQHRILEKAEIRLQTAFIILYMGDSNPKRQSTPLQAVIKGDEWHESSRILVKMMR